MFQPNRYKRFSWIARLFHMILKINGFDSLIQTKLRLDKRIRSSSSRACRQISFLFSLKRFYKGSRRHTRCQPAYSSASFSDGTRLLCHNLCYSYHFVDLSLLMNWNYELCYFVIVVAVERGEGLGWFWQVSTGLRKVHNFLTWILQRGAVASFPPISALNNCDFGYN